jgi:hypothetical protein
MSGLNYNPNMRGNSYLSNPPEQHINRFYDQQNQDYYQEEDYKAIER